MANRDDILRRIVAAAEYIEANQDRMNDSTKAEAMRRYDKIVAELDALTAEEKRKEAQVPQQVRSEMNKIRNILKKERKGA